MTTIYDVAERAGVSPATVSRVFNKAGRVRTVTRDRVLTAANELDYQPNRNGTAAAANKTLMIGLVTSDIQNPYAATVARGVQDMAAGQGYVSIICSTDGDPDKELRLMREIHRRGVDGFVLTPSPYGVSAELDAFVNSLSAENVPLVFIGNQQDRPDISFVTSRAQDGAVQAINHLAALGHKRIAFIGGHYTRGVAVGRWLGYQEAMIANRLPIHAELMKEADLSEAGGEKALRELLELDEPVTAILTVNDLVAIGVMNACAKQGIDVPSNMSIVGFDDIPLAQLMTPPLTTVAQPAYDLGYKAAAILLQMCQNPGMAAQHLLLHSSLVIRGTTSAPQHG
jgi:LacI family transcriptional regulator